MSSASGELAWIENRPRDRRLPRVDLRETWAYRELAYRPGPCATSSSATSRPYSGSPGRCSSPLRRGAGLHAGLRSRSSACRATASRIPSSCSPGSPSGSTSRRRSRRRLRALVENRELVTKVYFPRLLAPFAAVLPGLIDLGLSLGVVAILMVIYEVGPAARDPPLPLWILAVVLVAFAVGIWLVGAQRPLPRRALHARIHDPVLALRQPGRLPEPPGRAEAGNTSSTRTRWRGSSRASAGRLLGGPAPPGQALISACR